MKRIIFLLAGIIAFGNTALAKTTTSVKADASINNYVRGYGNSFIFMEAGIEFSIYPDGQFDFYMPQYGPDVSVGINTPGFTLSFNSGYNYNPYIQYDSFGAIIQIENTPIFYDFYGRVNQIGNIFITYNRFNRINRIGGLNIFYRNNVFYRYDGFINIYNRAYIWRPWHRFYAIPPINFCVVSVNPYRQFYSPIRHIYYRPYVNNVRHYNINGRRNGNTIGRRGNSSRISDRYAQTPRNERERNIRRRVEQNNAEITRVRTSRLSGDNVTTTRKSRGSEATTRTRTDRNNATTRTRGNTRAQSTNENTLTNRVSTTRSTTRAESPTRTQSSVKSTRTKKVRNNVTNSTNRVSKKVERTRNTSSVKPRATKSRTYSNTKSQSSRQRSVSQSRGRTSSKMTRSNSSTSNNRKATRSGSGKTRG